MHVAIVGGGLVGRLLGWRLTEEGFAVELFERESREGKNSSSYVAAAMLAPLSEFPDSESGIWELATESLKAWPAMLDELNVPYGFDGSVVVAHAQDVSLLTKFGNTLRRANLPGVRDLSSDELAALEPGLAGRFMQGILLQGEGWLDNRALLRALESRCGDIHFEHAATPTELDADVVVDCRGKDADDPDLRGVRGEVVRVFAPQVSLRRPIRLMHPKYQIYVSPRPDSTYVIGATQIESASSVPMTVRSALELLSAAYTLHAGFAEAEIVEMSVGIRPAYPDNLPRVQWRDDVLSINGLYRHGYLVAPAVIQTAVSEIKSLCKYSLTANL